MAEKAIPNLRGTDLMPAIGLTGVIVMMVLPVPAFFLDLTLVLSIALSFGVGGFAFMSKSLDFSAFPSVLLFSTLFRLALNGRRRG